MKPNVIYVYADDLGRGMLSCYGQRHFRTPNIDRLAAEGQRFTNAYGCAVCAPARASLLTGYHDCHAGTWAYTTGGAYLDLLDQPDRYALVREALNNTGFHARADEIHLPEVARRAGYVTGQIGKLEWGFSTTPEELRSHGWDYHFGYYDHVRCHGFYPPFLFENGERVDLPGNTRRDCGKGPDVEECQESYRQRWDPTGKALYSQDLFNEKIVAFIRHHRDRPFFLYHPSQLPHGPIAVPELHPGVADSADLTPVEKEYASMVLRLDDTVGLILDTLADCGLDEQTIVMFASDNGHEIYYPQPGRTSKRREALGGRPFDDFDFPYTSERSGDTFNGNDGMSGNKLSSRDGGARIPFLVRAPLFGQAGRVRHELIANYDVMPTLAQLTGGPCPEWKDGRSFRDLLTGERISPRGDVVFAGQFGPALVTEDGWKVRYLPARRRFQLFHLPADRREEHDLSAAQPERLRELGTRLLQACDGNFYHGCWDNHKSITIDQALADDGPDGHFPALTRWQAET